MRKPITTSEFIEKAISVHGSTYSYENTVYVNARSNISATCGTHGEFHVGADAHLAGSGCKLCGHARRAELQRGTTEQFVARANEAHGGRYLYSQTEYITAKIKVSIDCSVHGTFYQTPRRHLSGSGCPACATGGFKPSEAGILYVLIHENLVKIGITNRAVTDRIRDLRIDSGRIFTQVASFKFKQGRDALEIEQRVLRVLRKKYKTPTEVFNGYTECFVDTDISALVELIKEYSKSIAERMEQ